MMRRYFFTIFFLLTITRGITLQTKEIPMQLHSSLDHYTPDKQTIHVGKIYRHYSGKLYEVIALAHDSEDPSLIRVIYKGLYTCPTFGANPVWDRPYTMFAEHVTINGVVQPRFALVND